MNINRVVDVHGYETVNMLVLISHASSNFPHRTITVT
jgi:hypothetical protein